MIHPNTWDVFRDVALTIAGACLFWAFWRGWWSMR